MLGKKSPNSRGFRDRKRDAETDLRRSGIVAEAVADALASIDAEMTGLDRRVDELRAWVGGLIGPDDGSAGTRDSRIEADLVDAERQLMQGLKRLSDLAAMQERYRDLQTAIGIERELAFQEARADG